MLSRDEILGAADLAVESIHVPEWGGTVGIRPLTGAERDKFEQDIQAMRGRPADNVRARLVALCACDHQGQRLFTELDVQSLGAKSGAALERIFSRALTLNGMQPDAVETEKKS